MKLRNTKILDTFVRTPSINIDTESSRRKMLSFIHKIRNFKQTRAEERGEKKWKGDHTIFKHFNL